MPRKKNDESTTIRAGSWVAHESDRPDKIVAVAPTCDAVVRKLEAANKTDSVVVLQVPPKNCALIL